MKNKFFYLCGNCCLNLNDSCCTTADEEDLLRWEEEERWDILDYIDGGDLWISQKNMLYKPDAKDFIEKICSRKKSRLSELPFTFNILSIKREFLII